ncbi:MAG: transglycosylase SLT domain-containing protein [Mailhella sp.]|nr:transglycosylase SLT domain-containing protein [Mailhella sp.]
MLFFAVCPIAFNMGEACAGTSSRIGAKQPKKYVDKYLKARQRHARFGVAGIVPRNAGAIGEANYYRDSYSYDGRGLDSIMRLSNPDLTADKIEAYRRHITEWAKYYKLPPLLVAAVIHVESRFKENAYYLGNAGPMQVNITVHRERLKKLGVAVEELKTIEHGVHVGCNILSECISGSGGNYVRALTWYNGAMNPGYASMVLQMYAYGKGAAKK